MSEPMPVMRSRIKGTYGAGPQCYHRAPEELPWSLFELQSVINQCWRNHDQSPSRLRQRGGLSAREAQCALTKTPLSSFVAQTEKEAGVWLVVLVDAVKMLGPVKGLAAMDSYPDGLPEVVIDLDPKS